MRLLLTLLFIKISLASIAADITAVQNGSWTAPSTWDLNRAPADGDNVIIPAGILVTFINTPYPQNNPPARPTFQIKIFGTLDFSTPGNDKMYLDAGSSIQIYVGGKIQTTTSSTEIIAIYTGLLDNTVWIGTPSTINGPAFASATTLGFANGTLPVKIKSFEIQKSGESAAILRWITSSEINSSHFEIESYNNTNKAWSLLGTVNAASNSNVELKYAYTVPLSPGLNQFRLKEIDIDNRYVYSPVVTAISNEHRDAKFIYDPGNHLLKIASADEATIGIFDMSGRKILSLKYSGSAINLSSVQPAMYIVYLITKNQIQSSKILIR